MSIAITLSAIAVAVTATSWIGMRWTKESRELLREKREAEANKKAKEEADGRENNRRANFNREFMEMFDAVLNRPEQYTGASWVSDRNCKYPAVHDFIKTLKAAQELRRVNTNQAEQLAALHKANRELRAEVKEVHRAMALNTGGDF